MKPSMRMKRAAVPAPGAAIAGWAVLVLSLAMSGCGGKTDPDLYGSAIAEAQTFQVLRMRLIRDYSGLWLLANKP